MIHEHELLSQIIQDLNRVKKLIENLDTLEAGGGAVDSVNGETGEVVLDTDDISEGATNLYLTQERVEDYVGAMLADTSTVDLDYNDTTGQITATVLPAGVDHGALDGLDDDDHTQYILAAGTRELSGDWDIGEDRRILAEGLRARDDEGLKLEDDAGNLGILVKDGGAVLGALSAASATIAGVLSAASATIAGALSAASATLSATLSASGVSTGTLTVSGGDLTLIGGVGAPNSQSIKISNHVHPGAYFRRWFTHGLYRNNARIDVIDFDMNNFTAVNFRVSYSQFNTGTGSDEPRLGLAVGTITQNSIGTYPVKSVDYLDANHVTVGIDTSGSTVTIYLNRTGGSIFRNTNTLRNVCIEVAGIISNIVVHGD